MPVVRIDANRITDWDSFHDVFAEAFGFPRFYGRNLNAWIDCMTCLDDPSAGMTTVFGSEADPVGLQIDSVDRLPREVYDSLVESAAFVNWRRIEKSGSAILALSYYKA